MKVPDVNKPYGAWLLPDYAERIRKRHSAMESLGRLSLGFEFLYSDFHTVGLTRSNFVYYLAALGFSSAVVDEILDQADASLKVVKVLSELGD